MLSQSTNPRSDFRFAGANGYVSDDALTGLAMLGQRYYHPVIGRFLTRDPIGYQGGINLYAYTSNSPIGNIDPRGEAKIWIGWNSIPGTKFYHVKIIFKDEESGGLYVIEGQPNYNNFQPDQLVGHGKFVIDPKEYNDLVKIIKHTSKLILDDNKPLLDWADFFMRKQPDMSDIAYIHFAGINADNYRRRGGIGKYGNSNSYVREVLEQLALPAKTPLDPWKLPGWHLDPWGDNYTGSKKN